MKNLIVILAVISLVGCSAVPVARHFPDVPSDLQVTCPDLKEVSKGTDKLSDVVLVVSENYSQYHECRVKVDGWIEWYKTQKQIFEEVK